MAVNLDTRLPMSAITGPLNPADMLMKVQQFQQQQQANALQQRLDELRANREADLLARRERAGKSAYERLQGIQQGIPAQIDTVPQPMKQGPVLNQPAYGATMQVERAPAVPGRELTPEDYSREMANALFQQGDYEGAFKAMQEMQRGQVSPMKVYGGVTKTGKDGMEYVLNQNTGKYEPTGFAAQVKVVPQKQPRAPRTQVVSDETGTYVISLDNPQAPAIPVTKPGGVPIVKPAAGGGMPTEDERKAAGWFAQADNAWRNMQKVMAENPNASQQGFLDKVLPEGAANVVRTEERQKFLQGARSLSEAALRAATGAGVNADEARQKIEELTPVFGDKPGVIKQKMDSIKVYLDSLKTRAGRAAPKTASAPIQTNAMPPAAQYKGKIATDNTTGVRYKSDGSRWVRIP